MNGNNSKKSTQNGNFLLLGIPSFLAICCGLPSLLIAIGLTSIGTFLIGKEIWEFGVILLIIGLVMLIKNKRFKNSNKKDCCAPKFDDNAQKGGE